MRPARVASRRYADFEGLDWTRAPRFGFVPENLTFFGVGKSSVACAFAQNVCGDGYSPNHFCATCRLHVQTELAKPIGRLSGIDVLVIDDSVTARLAEPERRAFREICEDRYQVSLTIVTSQLPVSW